MNRVAKLLALLFPIVILSFFAIYQQLSLSEGKKIILPIKAYSARNFLSGNYLTYRIDYQISGLCGYKSNRSKQKFVCLKPNKYPALTLEELKTKNCQLFLKGRCRYSTFKAGIERIYIPSEYVDQLNKGVKKTKTTISVRVMKDGRAVVNELLLNGKPYRTYLSSAKNK